MSVLARVSDDDLCVLEGDFLKFYDQICRSLLKALMRAMGFPEEVIMWIRNKYHGQLIVSRTACSITDGYDEDAHLWTKEAHSVHYCP